MQNKMISNFIKNLYISQKYLWVRQFIKFSIVGGLGTIIDFSIYVLLTRFFLFWQENFLWANLLSISISATLNFILNKKWTFKDHSKKIFSQYIKFWVIVLTGLLIYQIIFYFSSEKLLIYDILSKIIAAVIVWIYRFILNKYWTFAK